ncbi:MAG: hypothetical protein M0Z49_10495 [Chloroflexi bacterium]|nr:hypothetical protein [Chloroflexota bacterium]
MNDQLRDDEFDRRLREATRRLAGGPASAGLRARIAAIPREQPGPANGRSRFGLSARFAGATAALLVLAVVAALLWGTLPHLNWVVPGASPTVQPSVEPSASPATASPSASPSAPPPSATPAPSATSSSADLWTAAPLPNTPSLQLASGTLRTLVLGLHAGQIAPQSRGAPTGPFVYLGPTSLPDDTWTRAKHLYVADVGGGSVRVVPVPSQGYEAIASAIESQGTLVVLVWQHTGGQPATRTMSWSDCSQPLEWRLLAAPAGADGLPSGAWRELDTATATRKFQSPQQGAAGCDEAMLPVIAVSGGRVAYDVDHPTSQFPAGSAIRIRSLSGGTLERTIDTQSQVERLALSASSVAWTESPNADAPGGPTQWRVMRAPLASGAASTVALGTLGQSWFGPPLYLVLDGDAVVVAEGGAGTNAGATLRVQGGSLEVLNPDSAVSCVPLAASSGMVILRCGTEGRNDGITAWSAASGLRLLAGTPTPNIWSEQLGDGWFAWQSYDTTGTKLGISALPLSALAGQ